METTESLTPRRRLARFSDRYGPLLLTLAVAAAVFAMAIDNSAYSLTSRCLIAILVWWTIALTVGLSLLPRRRPPASALIVGGFLAGLTICTLLSIAWSDSAERAFNEFNRVALYLGVFALVVLAGTRENLRCWAYGIAIGIAAVGLLALASRLFPDLVGTDEVGRAFGGLTRLSYPLEYWNGLAIFVALSFPLLLAAAVAAESVVLRAAALVPIPALSAVIYLASSRGGAATAIVGSLVLLACTNRRLATSGAIVCAAAGSARRSPC